MLFILTSANRPNIDTGFKKKFMTDFISSHGGLVVDDMKVRVFWDGLVCAQSVFPMFFFGTVL